MSPPPLLTLRLSHDQDVVTARQRAAELAAQLGFDLSDQTRIGTAISEIVRNAWRYGGGGDVTFDVVLEPAPQRLVVQVRDHGSGIAHLEEVLSGRYRSQTGMGVGIAGARRLLDSLDIRTTPQGTDVTMVKFLPARSAVLTPHRLAQLARTVANREPRSLAEEVHLQNQQLLRTLDELQKKQLELARLNSELEDTNRGVLALYAELDEKADHLRRADELKSRFLSNMTHEFRTPVNSIVGLCNLLEEERGRDGRPVEHEIHYIRKAADQLSEMVNDLLDLAKFEAGKTAVRVSTFDVPQLLGALRGMLRPLMINQALALVFEDGDGLPALTTDEGKVSQILRNLVSNALKYTERGEVRVSARMVGADTIAFAVSDTGIGIAPEDQARIFEEYTQLEHRLQRRIRGTGLGLPLSRKLAELLGGTLTVESEAGVGSTFTVRLPVAYSEAATAAPEPSFAWTPEPGRLPIVAVDDAEDAQYFYQRALAGTPFQWYPARTLLEAERAIAEAQPAAILLDLVLGDEDGWEVLEDMARRPAWQRVPTIVVSALHERERAMAAGAAAFLSKPLDRRSILEALRQVSTERADPIRVLIIDDEEVSRFLVRQCLPTPSFEVLEAATAEEGLRLAADQRPDVVLLDLVLPGMDGRTALQALRATPATSGIPVAIVTATALDAADRDLLLERARAVMAKSDLSRETLGSLVRTMVLI